MAGRNISVTHVALGTVRVMRTTGMMGEVVGMAASLCKKHQVLPRLIYQQHLPELRSLMQKGVGRKMVFLIIRILIGRLLWIDPERFICNNT